MLYATAVLQPPHLIRGMIHGSDESRQVDGEKRRRGDGWMDGWRGWRTVG